MNIKINGKSVYDSRIIVVLFLLILIEPAYFEQIDFIDTFYDYSRVICTLILVCCCILDKKITKSRLWIYVFFGMIFICTALGSGEIINYIKTCSSWFGMCLLFDLWLDHNPKVLLRSVNVLEIYIYINLLTVLLYPNGLYKTELYSFNWFLGYKNPQIRTILPIIAISLICSYWEYNKISIRSYVLLICSALTFVLIDSTTSLLGFAVFALLLILFHARNHRLPKILSLTNCAIASAIAFIGVAVLGWQNNFAYLFQNILGKDLTLHTRTQLWAMVFSAIKERFWFGYGYMSSVVYTDMFNSNYFTHPHNIFLYIMMTGGICLLIVFIIGIVLASQKLQRNIVGISSKIILYCLCSFFVMGIAESLTGTVLFYPMFVLAMNADKLYREEYTVTSRANANNTLRKFRLVFRRRNA